MTRRGRALRVMAIAALAVTVVAGCEQGPAERAGEKIDDAVDRLTGQGPAEKAGERIDEATEKLGQRIDAATKKLKKD